MEKYKIANVRQRTNHTFLWLIIYTLILNVIAGILTGLFKGLDIGLIQLIAVVVGAGLIYLCNYKRWPFELSCTDENKKKMTPVKFLILICLIFTCQLFTFCMMKLYTLTGLPEANIAADTLTNNTGISMVLYASLIGPIVEELIYRGFLIGSTKQSGKIIAIVISSICFGLMHGNPTQLIVGFATGLLLGYVFVEYSLIWTIILHVFNNFILNELPLLLFKDASVNGQVDFIILIAAIPLTIIAIIYLIKKKTISTFLKDPKNHGEKGAVKQTLSSVWFWIYIALYILITIMVIFSASLKLPRM